VRAILTRALPSLGDVRPEHPRRSWRLHRDVRQVLAHPSEAIASDSAETTWAALLALGWSLYKQGYALCPVCTKDPPNVDEDAARAMKKRKRR
jgi:hypothetical protein